MIDIDTDTVPVGAVGWSRFLTAVESADPTDETEWVEFKAGLNPADKEAQASIAKAIVAFANRDPHRAAKWFDGYAFILLGIEPGSVLGVTVLDPAKVHDGVHRLLSEPAPPWDLMYVTYKERQVLIVTVAPPVLGAPMYCIGKSSGSVRDGDVFVRHPGKSAPATAADVRRLSTRLLAGQSVALDVEVAVASESGSEYAVARTSWPTEWLEDWIRVERKRLLKPLVQEEREKARTLDSFSALSPSLDRLRGLGSMAAAGSFFEQPEDRTADGYRAEVEQYLDVSRSELHKAPRRASLGVLPTMRWTVTNRTDDNLEDVEIQVHIAGNVAFLSPPYGGFSVRKGLPQPPRLWGPRPIVDSATQFSRIMPQLGDNYRPTGPPPPRPHIQHGGSVTVTFPAAHLRPQATVTLDSEHVLFVGASEPSPLRASWKATATNVSGLAKGKMEIEMDPESIDIGETLRH